MTKYLTRLVVVGAIGVIAFSQAAFAQSDFDGKKFFNELEVRGVKTGGIDPKKFFEEMQATGASAKNPMDPDVFWQELAARGASAPAGFDSRKFFEELAATGAKAPDIVQPTKSK